MPHGSCAPLSYSARQYRGVTLADFTEPDVFFQLGIEPVRIDIMTSVTGLEFASVWERRVEIDFGGVVGAVLSRADLVTAKRAAGRPQDLEDARNLDRE